MMPGAPSPIQMGICGAERRAKPLGIFCKLKNIGTREDLKAGRRISPLQRALQLCILGNAYRPCQQIARPIHSVEAGSLPSFTDVPECPARTQVRKYADMAAHQVFARPIATSKLSSAFSDLTMLVSRNANRLIYPRR